MHHGGRRDLAVSVLKAILMQLNCVSVFAYDEPAYRIFDRSENIAFVKIADISSGTHGIPPSFATLSG
jgi:hypothetical protein